MKGFLAKIINQTRVLDGKLTREQITIPYDPIANDDIDSMYKDLKKNIDGRDLNQDIDENVPFNVQKVLQMQENTLNYIDKREKKFDDQYKHVAKKSSKKEEELLMKKIDHLRIRKELDEITINKNKCPGNYPHGGTWIMNLRANKGNLFPATSYLNYGDGTNPYYVPIRERRNKSIDIVRDPQSFSKIDNKLIHKNKELLSDKSNLNDKSSLNSSTLNFMQSICPNMNNCSINLDDSSVNTSIINKKPVGNLVVIKYFFYFT